MRYRTHLRYRVTFAFAFLGMLISLGLAISFYSITIKIEKQLIKETLSTELEDFIAQYKIDPDTPPPASTTIRTFVIKDGEQTIPFVIRQLTVGLHRILFEKKQYYAEVKVVNNKHFVVLYNDKQIRERENQLKYYLVIGVVMMMFFSALLGFWLAKRVTSPVSELALRVANLKPENYHLPLANDFPDDEVGMLAKDFDAYLQRLSAFIERERYFTSDVSHELRTPLTVIEGAADVLLNNPELTESNRRPIERISRSVHEMSELVSALLLLAREDESDVSESGCVVSEVLNSVLDGHQHLLKHKSVDIKLDIQAEIIVPVECTLLRVVLANLIRNAIYYTDKGLIIIVQAKDSISIQDSGIGIAEDQRQQIFERYFTGNEDGEGIGLSLVKRICQKYHWNVEIESEEGKGSLFQLCFKHMS